MKILLAGMNHESAPVEVRERYAIDDPAPALGKLMAYDEIDEAVIVSTCNRVELCVTTREPVAARHTLRRFFSSGGAAESAARHDPELDEHLYLYSGREAVQHAFRVAASIDSMVVGEPQILGQMKDAYRAAVEQNACGPVLSRLFQRAFATAKRVKNETGIARRPISVARVAVELAEQIFERFDDKKALLIGAGEMTEIALEALRSDGLGHVSVANRTRAHAEELAARFDASAHGLDEIEELLGDSDLVLTSIGGDAPIIDAAMVQRVLAQRALRPLFFIDIGVPRNIDPSVDEIDAAYLYDVDDLQQVSDENANERGREARRAEGIVREEEQRFDGWLVALEAVPTIRDLRARAEQIRGGELDRAFRRLDLDDEEREAVERLTQSIVNKLLHPPLARLREQTEREEGIAMLEAARALFSLDAPEEAEAGEPDTARARGPQRRPAKADGEEE